MPKQNKKGTESVNKIIAFISIVIILFVTLPLILPFIFTFLFYVLTPFPLSIKCKPIFTKLNRTHLIQTYPLKSDFSHDFNIYVMTDNYIDGKLADTWNPKAGCQYLNSGVIAIRQNYRKLQTRNFKVGINDKNLYNNNIDFNIPIKALAESYSVDKFGDVLVIQQKNPVWKENGYFINTEAIYFPLISTDNGITWDQIDSLDDTVLRKFIGSTDMIEIIINVEKVDDNTLSITFTSFNSLPHQEKEYTFIKKARGWIIK